MIFLQLGLSADDELATLLQLGNSIVDELVNDGLGGLLDVDNGGSLAHEEGAELLKRVVILLVVGLLGGLDDGRLLTTVEDLVEVGLVGDGTLGGELLHLLLAVGLPVVDVGVVAHAHGAASEDDCADVVVVTGGADGVLVGLGSAGLVGQDEAGADPDGGGTHDESRSEGLAVADTTGGDDLDRSAGQGRLGVADGLDDGGDQDSGGGITGVATTLTALGADDVGADVDALLDVLDVADHVHVEDAGLVQLVDDSLGGHADGADEQLGAGLDDDVDEAIELALCVVVAIRNSVSFCYVSLRFLLFFFPLLRSSQNFRLRRLWPKRPVVAKHVIIDNRGWRLFGVRLTWSYGRFHQPGGEAGQRQRERSCRSGSS